MDALRECAPIAKGRIPIAIDGGIRRGSDIFKALALGADYCFIGRIAIWGLAVGSYMLEIETRLMRQYNGQEGVELAIRILRQELAITMALAGFVFLLGHVGQMLIEQVSVYQGDSTRLSVDFTSRRQTVEAIRVE